MRPFGWSFLKIVLASPNISVVSVFFFAYTVASALYRWFPCCKCSIFTKHMVLGIFKYPRGLSECFLWPDFYVVCYQDYNICFPIDFICLINHHPSLTLAVFKSMFWVHCLHVHIVGFCFTGQFEVSLSQASPMTLIGLQLCPISL